MKSSKKQANKISGRTREQRILERLFATEKSEFLTLYGRRRVGKTFLIRNFFEKKPCLFFYVTGIQEGKLKEQLGQFTKQISAIFYEGISIVPYKSWSEAFEALTTAMLKVSKRQKTVLFFDEFPWMATKRSGLLSALEYFWNRHWTHDPRLKLILCGSSASWIIEKIVNNKGGLHNRVTRTMILEPLNLHDTKAYLADFGNKLNDRQVLDLYMVLGGIPHYLSLVEKGLSAQQSIEELFFRRDGALVNEFDRLFSSLFKDSSAHIDIIRIIANHRYGIGQAQLIREIKVSSGGGTTRRLKELEEAGFIVSFLPHGHSDKGLYYKVIDEYTLFYLHWLEPRITAIRNRDQSPGYWLSKSQSSSWKSWSGYAFEAVCSKHIAQIKKALNIDPGSESGSWRYVPRKNPESEKEGVGAQIDLLFDRPDQAITVCEIKYSMQPFTIDKVYAQTLAKKVEVYQQQTRTKKQIFLVMITSAGLKPSKHYDELISQEVTLGDLFKSV